MPCGVAQKRCASSQGSNGRRAGAPGAHDKENVDADAAEVEAGKERAAGAAETEPSRRSHADDGWGATIAALPAIKALLQAAAAAKVGTDCLAEEPGGSAVCG